MRTIIVVLSVLLMISLSWAKGPSEKDPTQGYDRLDFSFHVGSTHPITDDDSIDANIHGAIDLAYKLQLAKMVGRIKLHCGLNQLTTEGDVLRPHPRWTNVSGMLQFLGPISGSSLHWYVQGGAGNYWPKSGSSSIGYNAGLGFSIPIVSSLKMEWGVDFHRISTDEAVQFMTFHLGVLFL